MDEFEELLDDYTLPATIIPLADWNSKDLATLQTLINAELQRRHDLGLPEPGHE